MKTATYPSETKTYNTVYKEQPIATDIGLKAKTKLQANLSQRKDEMKALHLEKQAIG